MPIGPDPYDALTDAVQQLTEARGVILLVFGGKRGDGCSCHLPVALFAELPDVLRAMADEIAVELEVLPPMLRRRRDRWPPR